MKTALVALLSVLGASTVVAHEWHRHEDVQFANLQPLNEAELAMIAEETAAPPAAAFFTPAAGTPCDNAALMAASFGAFKPKVRFYWDATQFYAESDNFPDRTQMPNLMVGITSWQQQIPVPASYFASTVNPENNAGSLGYRQPNYWRLPLVPTDRKSTRLNSSHRT